jgi:hypothetical protein
MVEQMLAIWDAAESGTTRLTVGQLFGEVATLLSASVADSSPPRAKATGVLLSPSRGDSVKKLHLFSAHDMTLIPFLVGLGAPSSTWPPYASAIEIQLLEQPKTKQKFVKVLYNDGLLAIPGCGGKVVCPLEHFLVVMRKVALSEKVRACMCSPEKEGPPDIGDSQAITTSNDAVVSQI